MVVRWLILCMVTRVVTGLQIRSICPRQLEGFSKWVSILGGISRFGALL